MRSQEEIYTAVSGVLIDALNVEEDEIEPSAKLYADLGADDIDLLDIVFRLEREFGIKIPRNELFPEEVIESGAAPELGKESTLDDPRDQFTVEMICKYVEGKLKG